MKQSFFFQRNLNFFENKFKKFKLSNLSDRICAYKKSEMNYCELIKFDGICFLSLHIAISDSHTYLVKNLNFLLKIIINL